MAYTMMPIPKAAQPKAWVSGHSLAGVVGSNLSLVNVVCYHVEVSVFG